MRWLVEIECSAPPVLGDRSRIRTTTRVVGVFEAEKADEACRAAAERCSVYELKYGVRLSAYGLRRPDAVWQAQYDSEPMVDHMATRAELVFTRSPQR